MTRDEFMGAILNVRWNVTEWNERSYRRYFIDLFQRYLTHLGSTPQMAEWAAERLEDDLIARQVLISDGSAAWVADELERMVRA